VPYCYEYPRPSLSADIAIFRKNGNVPEILLIRRKNPPYQGMWSIPGGFMEIDETLEQTAARELEEETGLKGVNLRQVRACSRVDRDPRTRVVTVLFTGEVEMEHSEVTGGDDAESAEWFPLNELPPLGFDHDEMVALLIASF
jgi:8-oxo-dGTP diphosphatase